MVISYRSHTSLDTRRSPIGISRTHPPKNYTSPTIVSIHESCLAKVRQLLKEVDCLRYDCGQDVKHTDKTSDRQFQLESPQLTFTYDTGNRKM